MSLCLISQSLTTRWLGYQSSLHANVTKLAQREESARSYGSKYEEIRRNNRLSRFSSLDKAVQTETTDDSLLTLRNSFLSGSHGSSVQQEIVGKTNAMRALSKVSRNNQINLDLASFKDLVLGPNRDYWTIIIATAMNPDFGCTHCQRFAPILEATTQIARKENFSSYLAHQSLTQSAEAVLSKLAVEDLQKISSISDLPLHFVILDPSHSKVIFSYLGLQQAPLATLLAPGYGDHSRVNPHDLFSDTPNSFGKHHIPLSHINSVEDMFKTLKRHMGRSFEMNAPPATVPVIVYIVILGLAVAIALFSERVWGILAQVPLLLRTLSPIFLVVITVAYIYAISGAKFSQINKVEWARMSRGQPPMYVNPGVMDQFGAETVIVGINQFLLVAALLLLTIFAQYVRASDYMTNAAQGIQENVVPFSAKYWALTRTSTEEALDVDFADVADGITPLPKATTAVSTPNTRGSGAAMIPVAASAAQYHMSISKSKSQHGLSTDGANGILNKTLDFLKLYGTNFIINVLLIGLVCFWVHYIQVYSSKNTLYRMGFVW